MLNSSLKLLKTFKDSCESWIFTGVGNCCRNLPLARALNRQSNAPLSPGPTPGDTSSFSDSRQRESDDSCTDNYNVVASLHGVPHRGQLVPFSSAQGEGFSEPWL